MSQQKEMATGRWYNPICFVEISQWFCFVFACDMNGHGSAAAGAFDLFTDDMLREVLLRGRLANKRFRSFFLFSTFCNPAIPVPILLAHPLFT